MSHHSELYCQLTVEAAAEARTHTAAAMADLEEVELNRVTRPKGTVGMDPTVAVVAVATTAKEATAEHMAAEAEVEVRAIPEPEATAEPMAAAEVAVIISLTPRLFLAEQAGFHPAAVAVPVNPGTAAEERIR